MYLIVPLRFLVFVGHLIFLFLFGSCYLVSLLFLYLLFLFSVLICYSQRRKVAEPLQKRTTLRWPFSLYLSLSFISLLHLLVLALPV